MAINLESLVPIGLLLGAGYLMMRGGGCCGAPATRQHRVDVPEHRQGIGRPAAGRSPAGAAGAAGKG